MGYKQLQYRNKTPGKKKKLAKWSIAGQRKHQSLIAARHWMARTIQYMVFVSLSQITMNQQPTNIVLKLSSVLHFSRKKYDSHE